MNLRHFLAVIFIVLTVVAFQSGAWAQDDQTRQLSDISSKLDQILSNQKTIFDEIAQIKEELNIVKIRVTQQQ